MINYIIACTDDDISSCLNIRHEVFIIGQNIPELLELDGLDDKSIHFLAKDNDKTIATARIRIIDNNIAKIERVAVLENYRGKAIGRGLMNFIITELYRKPEVNKIKLSSQTSAIKFYEQLGFVVFGDEYIDANIPHYDMILS